MKETGTEYRGEKGTKGRKAKGKEERLHERRNTLLNFDEPISLFK